MEPSIRICHKMPGEKVKCLSFDFSPLSCRTCTVPASTRKPIEREIIINTIKEEPDMKNKTQDKMRNILETLVNEIGREWTKLDVKKLLKKAETTTAMFALLCKMGIIEKERNGLKYKYRISMNLDLTDNFIDLISERYSNIWSKSKTINSMSDLKMENPPPPPPRKSIDVEKFEKKIMEGMERQLDPKAQFRLVEAFTDAEHIAMIKMARDNKQDAIVRKLVEAL